MMHRRTATPTVVRMDDVMMIMIMTMFVLVA